MSKGWLGLMTGGLVLLSDPSIVVEIAGVQFQERSAIAANPQVIEFEGDRLRVNGQNLRGHWAVWTEAGETKIGIESLGLEKSLGVKLLDTNRTDEQPIEWFGVGDRLSINFSNPYRYLDITDFAKTAGWQWQQRGNELELTTPQAKISNIRVGNQDWGKRIVVDLDRPVAWRQSASNKIEIQANSGAQLDSFLKQNDFKIPPFEPFDSQNAPAIPKPKPQQIFDLTQSGNKTILSVPENWAPQMRVLSLANPPRLVIDLSRDNRPSRNIAWLKGMTWRQNNVVLPGKNNGGFAVTWLEINPKKNSFILKPISPSEQTIVGLAPMLTQVQTSGAIAGINAGFFNRNNQYPLGAVQTNGEWRSSPILNRGAVAWDNDGNWVFDRLSLREDIVADNGEQLTIDFLNSGYVKAGVSRYTKAWGDRYQTTVDNEVILVIDSRGTSEIVLDRKQGGQAGGDRYVIPENGYLLAFRSFRSGADKLPVGTAFQRYSTLNPSSFENFPNIMGAGPLLLQKGQVVLNGEGEQFSKAFNSQSASRSAIARTRDGKILLATVHGTAAETSGATLREWSEVLLHLGAVDALNLDGGGSSALVLGGDLGDRHSSTVGRVNNGIGLFLDNK
ncbi:phosphodiester glycosidase family protein [[Leptolyngbya] sp. PCC 7376]|uniref:phosphodiester glycosidase family protein n=1 Tax=[Leptolyngbya] sp. PCC 7376 TaxID=111781 RepID=UPI00031040EC|nr:phosphodiester glycosidase family protein [[Leptolyngbya] sp. PCC 7376]